MDVCCSPGMTKAEKAEAEARERKWRAEADMRTLIDAERIKKDPDRMKGVKEQVAEQRKVLDSIKV